MGGEGSLETFMQMYSFYIPYYHYSNILVLTYNYVTGLSLYDDEFFTVV